MTSTKINSSILTSTHINNAHLPKRAGNFMQADITNAQVYENPHAMSTKYCKTIYIKKQNLQQLAEHVIDPRYDYIYDKIIVLLSCFINFKFVQQQTSLYKINRAVNYAKSKAITIFCFPTKAHNIPK